MPEQQVPQESSQSIEPAAGQPVGPPAAHPTATENRVEVSGDAQDSLAPPVETVPDAPLEVAESGPATVESTPLSDSGPDAPASPPDMEAVGDPSGADSEQSVLSGELEELILPSLIQAPEPLPAGTVLGPDGRVQIVEYVKTRGRTNQYTARWRQDTDTELDVELREGPADDAGLLHEAEVLTAVQYAMLPRLYQTWEADTRRYLALERCQGETLERALAAGLPTDQALSVSLQLVQVVRRLHQAGWALLGLSPADVILSKPLHISHVRQAGRIGQPQTQALHVSGFSAPELASQSPVTGKEDVYTLGALLYHALTGHPLSDDDSVDLSSTVRLPGGPQLLTEMLGPVDERLDVDALYKRLLTLKGRHAETSLSLEIASATTLGLNPTRLVNEDTCGYAQWSQSGADGTKDIALLCVADGMGGMEAGEIASQTAVNVVMRGAVEMLWPAQTAGSVKSGAKTGTESGDTASRIDPVRLIRDAATAVHGAAEGRDLGTTATVVTVHGRELTLGHVGDTRAYLFRDGALTHLTADHSLVAAMVASGVLKPEEAQGHPDSNKVLRSLGSQRVLPDTYVDDLQAAYGQQSLTLAQDDWLLICSDGVWGSVIDAEIQVILSEALDHHIAARALIDRALAAGAPDNATAIVARCITRSTL
jgi:serine/threonine protein phosphatase PrpC